MNTALAANVLSVDTFVNVVVASMVYELDVIVFVTPFKVTFMLFPFLLLTEAILPLTVAITVVPSDCLASINVLIFGKE